MTPQLKILTGDCREVIKTLPDASVQMCVTSPPYWGLRDYGTATWEAPEGANIASTVDWRACDHKRNVADVTTQYASASTLNGSTTRQEGLGATRGYMGNCPKCGAIRVDSQIGQEKTPQEFVETMVSVFREVRRVLKDDGVLFLNLGDSYNAHPGQRKTTDKAGDKQMTNGGSPGSPSRSVDGLKPKDLVGIPWMTAFALRADGWYLRQDIIWCLSGGTWVYARTKKGDMPMMLRDAARLNPATVKLWNGEKWTQVLGWSRTARNADELELVLRSGERISCTPTHQFPTARGLLRADQIQEGDTLTRVGLPQPDEVKRPEHITDDAAWFAGLYLAEGSMSGDTIQLAGHATQEDRWERVQRIAASYGGSATITVDGNKQSIRVYGRMMCALIQTLVAGRTAHDKGLSPICWRYTNGFLRAMLDGYLSGDGHYDATNDRWRLGFTRNYNLERDLRTLSARLGFKLRLATCFVDGFGKKWPAFKGEIRFSTSGHHNEKSMEDVMEIRKSRCREVYDVGVEDEPHLFALASGILTHNSKPNPMPESVTDRCTKAHEYIFLLSKSERYYYNHEAIKEPAICGDPRKPYAPGQVDSRGNGHDRNGGKIRESVKRGGFNGKTNAMPGLEAFRAVEDWRNKRSVWTVSTSPYPEAHFATYPPDLIKPCILAGSRVGDTIVDPFGGSGTSGQVALELGRSAILIELNESYVDLIRKRTDVTPGLALA
jgi:DNA modification methylase